MERRVETHGIAAPEPLRMTPLPILLPFGLGFANPLILWGLAAASLPILLHLLNRRRYREERWAAMRFLLAAIRKNQRRIRLEQWLLLLVRTALIACLVLAMAQPFLESTGAVPLLAGRRTHRVLVIDASMSMAASTADQSQFNRAVAYADAYVEGARSGDAISVVLLGDPPRVVIGAPSPNHDEVREELRQVRRTDGNGDVETTLRKVEEVLASSDLPQKEVLLLTDLQAGTWGVAPESESAWKKAVADLEEEEANVVLVDLGQPNPTNRAVVAAELDTPVVVRGGRPTTITARLANYGTETERGVRARLVVDGRLGPERAVDLPPGQETPVAFSYRFEEPGDHVAEVRIDEDRIAVDDARRLVVPVREHLQALLVAGDYDPEPFATGTDYLAQALSPTEGSDRSPSPIQVQVATESQLSRNDLDRFDVVFLCNVARLSPTEVDALDRFLRRGGGVVWFGGDRVQADSYNENAYAGGPGEDERSKGFLPAKVVEVVDAGDLDDPDALAEAPEFDPLGFEHPIVAEYQGAPPLVRAGLTAVRTWRYHALTVPRGSTARVALAFTDGRPAVLTMPRHRGQVVQIATSADDDWSTWPLHPSYPPVMEQVAYFAASGRMAERNVRVGQPLDQAFEPEAANATAVVQLPDGRDEPGRLIDEGDGARFRFEGTDEAGVYAVRLGAPIARQFAFAANPDPIESDPARVDPSTLKALMPRWKFSIWDGGPVDRVDAASVGRRGELHRALLPAVLGLVLGESLLAWWIGRRR